MKRGGKIGASEDIARVHRLPSLTNNYGENLKQGQAKKFTKILLGVTALVSSVVSYVIQDSFVYR
jgi:hypothetical protein